MTTGRRFCGLSGTLFMRREDIDWREAFGSGVNGAVTGAVKHYLQKLTSSTYGKIHEFEAYTFQAKVDKTFPLKTSQAIWNFINTQPAYKNLK